MRKILFLLVLIVLGILSCQNEECKCEINQDEINQNDSIINLIVNQPGNEFENYWSNFEEPILNDQNNESYRLSIFVLLYDYLKIYRIEKDRLYIKEYAVSTTTRSREDSLVSSYAKEITEVEWYEIVDLISGNCFWTMPMDIKEDDGWLDGSGWTLEGVKEKNNCTESKYHLLYRHSPFATNDSSKFVRICEKFIELDSLNVRRF